MAQPSSQRSRRRRPIREEFTNLPNLLTLGRIALIPPVMILMLQDSRVANFFATALFSLAAITDWLDGWLARRRGQESLVGKLLDPLADKLIVMATLVVCAQLGRIPSWFVVLLLSRELAISGLRGIASQEGLQIPVVRLGKLKTAFQLTGLVGLLIHETYVIDFLFVSAPVDFNALGLALLVVAFAFSVLSAGVYVRGFLGAVAQQKIGDEP